MYARQVMYHRATNPALKLMWFLPLKKIDILFLTMCICMYVVVYGYVHECSVYGGQKGASNSTRAGVNGQLRVGHPIGLLWTKLTRTVHTLSHFSSPHDSLNAYILILFFIVLLFYYWLAGLTGYWAPGIRFSPAPSQCLGYGELTTLPGTYIFLVLR